MPEGREEALIGEATGSHGEMVSFVSLGVHSWFASTSFRLRAGLKMERGCVESQPQHGANTPRHRNWGAGCGWSRTTHPPGFSARL